LHYLVFIPGAENMVPPKALTDCGLADHVAGAEAIPITSGPVETHGLLCAWRRHGKNEKMHYNSTEQTWIPALPNGPDGQGRGRYHVGFWNDSSPTPEDLKRRFQLYGPMIELGDGNQWRIPVVDELPKNFIADDDGSWKGIVKSEYHELWMESLDWQAKVDSQKLNATYADLLDFGEKILRHNYRVTREVISHLKLFTSSNISTVFVTAINRAPQGVS
jgi:hypothetical protein